MLVEEKLDRNVEDGVTIQEVAETKEQRSESKHR